MYYIKLRDVYNKKNYQHNRVKTRHSYLEKLIRSLRITILGPSETTEETIDNTVYKTRVEHIKDGG